MQNGTWSSFFGRGNLVKCCRIYLGSAEAPFVSNFNTLVCANKTTTLASCPFKCWTKSYLFKLAKWASAHAQHCTNTTSTAPDWENKSLPPFRTNRISSFPRWKEIRSSRYEILLLSRVIYGDRRNSQFLITTWLLSKFESDKNFKF